MISFYSFLHVISYEDFLNLNLQLTFTFELRFSLKKRLKRVTEMGQKGQNITFVAIVTDWISSNNNRGKWRFKVLRCSNKSFLVFKKTLLLNHWWFTPDVVVVHHRIRYYFDNPSFTCRRIGNEQFFSKLVGVFKCRMRYFSFHTLRLAFASAQAKS